MKFCVGLPDRHTPDEAQRLKRFDNKNEIKSPYLNNLICYFIVISDEKELYNLGILALNA